MRKFPRQFCFACLGLISFAANGAPQSPEPFPPAIGEPTALTGATARSAEHKAPLSQSEWTYHKSADGTRPSGVEQQYVWLMNRARTNPTVEGVWLSLVPDAQIQNAVSFFNVNLDILREEFAAIPARPPAAFDVRLHNAAVDHSNYLISVDGQNHNGQSTRVTDAGFSWTSYRGSVFSYSRNGPYGHAGFNIDWGGNDGTGMQTGRGHRAGLMGNYSNVGVGIVEDNDNTNAIGPQVTTINYCNARSSSPDHYNRFIVGTVWEDLNGNQLYDPGEGLGGVTVMPDSGNFFAVTGEAGGYAIPADAGNYQLTFTGGSLAQTVTKEVTVGTGSALVPWLNFPAEAQLVGASVEIDSTTRETDASWSVVYGQPTSIVVSDNLVDWEIIDSGKSTIGSTVSWSEAWPGGSPRFWRVQSWSYLE